MSTPYHAIYYAYELTKQGGRGIDRLSKSLFDACVDLNPHQIEAALFAVRSPLSKGVLLADEVGLGKTIEAGLVLCQYWAERKRKLIVICPASLRKQWAIELEEKFNLPCTIIDAKHYKDALKRDELNPFDINSIVITSTHFANRRAEEINVTPWDLAVIDEAHKLRNAYRKSNKMGQQIRWALNDTRKILLTATPLQNSLLELYGLSTIIDERIFGDLPSFRTQYTNVGADLKDLRDRLRFFCKRTLRRQVTEYIRYTERKPLTKPFTPTEQEHKLYEAISNFLQREETFALPQRQKHLTTLVIRKLLASSSKAVAGTLETMRDRLIAIRDNLEQDKDIVEKIILDEEIEDELLDEFLNDENESDDSEQSESETISQIDKRKLNQEIEELDRYINWAYSIGIDSKTKALLKALEIGFSQMQQMGAQQKAVIFTESRRTQSFIKEFLEANGYLNKVITFNGTNTDQDSKRIYENWVSTNEETGRITGSKQVNIRTALIEYFRDTAQIMIATEAAAEGINLQFCSLVINYDLPWNPQRIEQRIGRCHRYGQKHDVVVINFLNERNEADRRVYELLNEKFNLFSGVFGSSDEVLGSIESGVDFEKRILEIYQECRTQEEIEQAFKRLQDELDEKIKTKLDDTRQILLEHFDEEVHERLRDNLTNTHQQLDKIGRMFWGVTKYILANQADFDDKTWTFNLTEKPIENIHIGKYHLISKEQPNIPSDFLYRLSHPLGEHVLEQGKSIECSCAEVSFDISNHPTKISVIESLKGKSGWLTLQYLNIESFEKEEYLLFSGMDDDKKSLDQEVLEKMFLCTGTINKSIELPVEIKNHLDQNMDRHKKATINHSLEENNKHFNEAREKLEKWADDMILASEKELHETKQQIKALTRESRMATTMEDQHSIQERIATLEKKKRKQRQRIFEIEDEIIEKRDALINSLEKRMIQRTNSHVLFTVRWKII